MPTFHKVFWMIAASLLMAGCLKGSDEKNYEVAEKLLQDGNVPAAQEEFKKIFERGSDKEHVLKSAEKLYEISFLKTKDFKASIKYLDVIIANSTDFSQSYEALKKRRLFNTSTSPFLSLRLLRIIAFLLFRI